MKYLHTMVRVSNLEESLKFYVDSLGLVEVNRFDVEAGRFTLVFLAAAGDKEAQIELKQQLALQQANTLISKRN